MNSVTQGADAAIDERQAQVRAVFAEGGALARTMPVYRRRQSQEDMALAVLDAIACRSTLAAEAGTGTGKTMAYLVPAILSGGKVLISVATKALQDQVFSKDLPAAIAALGVHVDVALLKGRQNYVCKWRLEQTVAEGFLASPQEVNTLQKVVRFARTSETGDRAEIVGMPDSVGFWHQVSSSRDNCLGTDCAHYESCFVVRARRRAMAADVVVINHHLLLADISLRESTDSELLPNADVLIIDEAHHLARTGADFFGQRWSLLQVQELASDSLRVGMTAARDGASWPELQRQLEHAVKELRLQMSQAGFVRGGRLSLDATNGPSLVPGLWALVQAMSALEAVLNQNRGRDAELDLLLPRTQALKEQIQNWHQICSAAQSEAGSAVVRWMSLSQTGAQFHATPIDCSQSFVQARMQREQAWILTSATLTAGGRFDPLLRDLGLPLRTTCLRWESPFDYARQGLLYLPVPMPSALAEDFPELVAEAAWPVLLASQGRAFILCSTLRAVFRVAQRLRELIAFEGIDMPVLEQGVQARRAMLDDFRRSGRAVLVGSVSFWEGIDVQGDALSVVVIDKLPFAPPDDPVVAGRIRHLKESGGNAFKDYQLPQAITLLRQGAGRLIRGDNDKGVLMILDERVLSRSYGKTVLNSLPPFTLTRSEAAACQFVAALPPVPPVNAGN